MNAIQLEQQMVDSFHEGEDGIPKPNFDGLDSLRGIKPTLELVDPKDTNKEENIARPYGGYKSADRKAVKISIEQNGFNKKLTIPVLVKLSDNSYRRLNGVTRFSLYGPGSDSWNISKVLVWTIPNVISKHDEYVLAGRLNPMPPMQSPLTRKDTILMAMELIKSGHLAKSDNKITEFVESISAKPDDENTNVRSESWKSQTRNSILREVGVGIGRYPTYTTDVDANEFYTKHNIMLPWSNGRIVKIHGLRASDYLKPRTRHIAVRMNGADDFAIATMDSLAMRRNHDRVSKGLGPVLTHVHIDIDVTLGNASVPQKRKKAQEVIYRFVKLMKDRGTHKFHWVTDGFDPKDKSIDDMNSFITWMYDPSK